MYYVMSDIHGEYEKYRAMLEKIRFSDEDVLYVLGDVIDRGPEPIKALLDMSARFNVYPLIGNHECMALAVLRPLMVEITEENWETQVTAETLNALSRWQMDGGDVTLKQFRALTREERMALLEYLEEFAPYETVEVNGTTYVLVHAGLGNYDKNKRLDEYSIAELAFDRPSVDTVYYDESVKVIVGHTPTRAMHPSWDIFRSGNMTWIDCGAAFGGKLACLCLDTMEEYYVE